jgi:hypothetical protein
MNSFLVKTENLATGNSLPFTGQWVSTVLGRNALIVSYVSGANATLNLEAQSLINVSGIPNSYSIFLQTGVSGYLSAFLDSPVPFVRMSSQTTGAGKIWSYITYQN